MRRSASSVALVAFGVGIAVLGAACAAVSAPAASPSGPSELARAEAPPRGPEPVAADVLAVADSSFVLDGRPYRPIGLNAYQLATRWGQNMGCGGMLSDTQLDSFLGSLPDGALLRFWAWQGSMATNPDTGERDWRPLDRVVAAAERHHVFLVVSLGSQHGNCDDGRWKDPSWYEGGYRELASGDGYARTTVPYPDYVREVVTRYRDSSAVAMWEPLNEPEAATCGPGKVAARCYESLSCPDPQRATAALRRFADEIGALIRSIDPTHLIESGSIGGGQCGWDGDGFSTIAASPGLDVTSFHAYAGSADDLALVTRRVAESNALGKPLLVGETGLPAATTGIAGECSDRAERSRVMRASIDAMLASGADGVALWNAGPDVAPGCSYDIGPDDPVLGLLRGT